ncbi:hypothetical protein XENOCAPTIV_025757 [Xenoophorus captivus]|uniref:Uncharacterized protein n=1 Tax=Xenoophorus captivus TaxID=1517983 RepID=A0ABV0RX40_9TELE
MLKATVSSQVQKNVLSEDVKLAVLFQRDSQTQCNRKTTFKHQCNAHLTLFHSYFDHQIRQDAMKCSKNVEEFSHMGTRVCTCLLQNRCNRGSNTTAIAQ